MTLHLLHRAAVVPKAPVLFPDRLDDMLDERFDTTVLGLIAMMRGKERMSEIHDRWADRLTARIDREPKE